MIVVNVLSMSNIFPSGCFMTMVHTAPISNDNTVCLQKCYTGENRDFKGIHFLYIWVSLYDVFLFTRAHYVFIERPVHFENIRRN